MIQNTVKTNRKRLLEELQKFLSPTTSLLHFNRGVIPPQKDDCIPLAYNFLYLLLLFRTKERTYIEKALEELNHLLYFQIQEGASKGNFPNYLHQYPFCERQFEALYSLYPLYWIALEFSSIIEAKLRDRLLNALKLGVNFLENQEPEKKEYSYVLSLQIAALTLAIGALLKQELWVEHGREKLGQLAKRGPQECFGSPRSLSKILIALEVLPEEDLTHWNFFFSYLRKTWNPTMKSYFGPSLSEYFETTHEEYTLYHLFMEKQSETHKEELFSPITLLEGELLSDLNLKPEIGTQNSFLPLGSYEWKNHQEENFAYSFFNIPQSEWVKTGGFYPLKILIKNTHGSDDFILQMGHFVQIEALESNKLLLTFAPGDEEELDISFFWNLSSKAVYSIDGTKASSFQLHQSLEILFSSAIIKFSFPNHSDAIWGQFLHKNRRTQLIESNYQTFDGHLYFRQIRNVVEPLKIQIELKSVTPSLGRDVVRH